MAMTLDEIMGAQTVAPAATRGKTLDEITGVAPPETWKDTAKNVGKFVTDPNEMIALTNTFGKTVVQGADMILGIPAWLAQMGLTGVAAGSFAARGLTQYAKPGDLEHPIAKGAQLVGEATERTGMLTPLQSYVLNDGKSEGTTPIDTAMQAQEGVVNRAADYWSEKTGNPETGEALKQAVQIGMALLPKGGEAVGKEMKARAAKKPAAVVDSPSTPAVESTPTAAAEPLPYQDIINRTTGVPDLSPQEAIAASKKRIADVRAAVKAGDEVTRASVVPPEPGPATWINGGQEFPLDVIGPPEKGPDGRTYSKVAYDGNTSYVPTEELTARVAPPPAQVGLPEPKTPVSFPPQEGVAKTRMTEGKTLEELQNPPAPLDTALAKVKTGRYFDLDATEKIALNSVQKAVGRIVDAEGKPLQQGFQGGAADPRLLAALGIGSMAVLAALNPEDMDKFATLGLIGITAKAGELGRLAKLSERVATGAPYLSKTLDALVKLRDSDVYSKEQVLQLLNRPELKVESDIIRRVVAAQDGNSITAMDLHNGFMEEVANWKLDRNTTDQYTTRDPDFQRAEWVKQSYERIGRIAPKDYTQQRLLPKHLQVDDMKHFDGGNTFGWDRGFRDEGLRHVVELQSDVAQDGRPLSEARVDALYKEAEGIGEELQQLRQTVKDGTETDGTYERIKELRDRNTQINIDLGKAATVSQVSPILKLADRRLIREVLLEEAESGNTHAMFASADTVAKVEGWPRAAADLEFIDPKTREISRRDFMDKGHQAIYNRYAGETTRYLKGLGGVEVRDAFGHTWWDVPTKGAVVDVKSIAADGTIKATPGIHMLGAAAPKLLAAIAGGVAAGAYLLNGDHAQDLMLLGVGGIAVKGLKGHLESDLIRLAREGKTAAFTELYTRNEPQIRRSLHSFERNGIDIDEVIQRTFTNGFKAILRPENDPRYFRGDAKLPTFLYRIAQNLAKNAVDAAKRMPKGEELTPELENTLGHNVTPEAIKQNKELGTSLDRALEKIDPTFKEAFLLKEVEGLDYADIAEKVGVPIGTVRSRIFRAKEQLQRYLSNYQDGATGQSDFSASAATGRLGSKEGGASTIDETFKRAAIFSAIAAGAYLDAEHPIEGGLLGLAASVGLMGVKSIGLKGIKEYVAQMQNTKPYLDIGPQIMNTSWQIWRADRLAKSMTKLTERELPEVASREQVYMALSGEAPRASTPKELATVVTYREAFNRLGEYAKDAGVIKTLVQDYATRIYGKEAVSWALDRVKGGVSMDSPFGKRRMFPTLAEAEAAGFRPITKDITKVFEEYSHSITTAVENRKLIDVLKGIQTGVGENLGVMKENAAPPDYKFIDHPSLRGYRVHPDYAPDLSMLLETFKPGAILNVLDVINTTQKRGAVVLSMFHPMAISHAYIGAMPLKEGIPGALKNMAQSLGPRGAAMLGGAIFGNQLNPDHPLLGLAGGAALGGWAGKYLPKRMFGESEALKQMYNGGAGDFIDTAAKYGFRPGFENATPTLADMKGNYYQAMEHISTVLDKTSGGLGKNTVGRYTELNHQGDNFLFGRLMPMTKTMMLMQKVRELQRNNAREFEAGRQALKSEKEIFNTAISFTDDIIGGQNYTRLSQEFTTRLGRAIAASALGPTGQFIGRMGLFAMDWTISTLRSHIKAFSNEGKLVAAGAIAGTQMDDQNKAVLGTIGGILGLGLAKGLGVKGGEGSGFRGLVRPTELADLHRQYLMRSTVIYTAAIDWLNYQNTGHHYWENKDITRLENSDGTTTQVSKHFWEPVHWLLTPRQQLINKGSFLVKEAGAQLLNADYLSTHKTPTMGDKPLRPGMSTEEMLAATKGNPTLQDRVAHAGRAFSPITLQQNWEGTGTSGIGGFLGSPTFGMSVDKKLEQKQLLKQLHTSPEYRAMQAEKKLQKRGA